MIGGRLGIHYAVNDEGEERRNGLSDDGVSPWREDVIFTSDDLITQYDVVKPVVFFLSLIDIGVLYTNFNKNKKLTEGVLKITK